MSKNYLRLLTMLLGTIIFSPGERLWPNPPRCLDTVADGMRMQQLAEKTWPIVLKLAEKDVFTVVSTMFGLTVCSV